MSISHCTRLAQQEGPGLTLEYTLLKGAVLLILNDIVSSGNCTLIWQSRTRFISRVGRDWKQHAGKTGSRIRTASK